eukprot:CAMPEP_0116887674 /NCGR_PEP_ID=MMETSP0463-20121206/22280_1 /TAXON_ID=181622 /ORGANISM="Strombidinopsis sp, Strain SopsisLIS2011" /LENGTH=31 /DNA_ID= /DNA_START= /DNA_END= /DNA_ORIENTATION=
MKDSKHMSKYENDSPIKQAKKVVKDSTSDTQ